MRLSVTAESLPKLTTHAVQRWLQIRGIHQTLTDRNRDLHGCLIARAGHAIIFLDALDDDNERRFTLAHEIAHFILDHLLPRFKALKLFGDQILPVLNGERWPTTEEMLSATLRRVPLGFQIHLMDREASGSIASWDIEDTEQRADRLALELLAPSHFVADEVRAGFAAVSDTIARRRRLSQCIAERFGLPLGIAASYSSVFERRMTKKRTLSEQIFGGK
jgi:hypothetical protein